MRQSLPIKMRVTLVICLFVGLGAQGQITEAHMGCTSVGCPPIRFGGSPGKWMPRPNSGYGLGQTYHQSNYWYPGKWSPSGQQWPIGHAISTCHECGMGVLGFIGKIEQMILSLPLAIIKSVISIPVNIVKIAIKIGSSLLNVCKSAKDMLLGFVGTLFEIPAKIMLGSVKLFLGFLRRVLDWGIGCKGQEYCQAPLPAYNGIGPCAGVWPCTNTIACATETCNRAARDLQKE